MRQREISLLLLVAGAIAIALALLADTIGVGGQEDTFGWKQLALVIVGALLLAGGVLGLARPGARSGERDAERRPPPSAAA